MKTIQISTKIMKKIEEKAKETVDKYRVPPFVRCPTSMKIWCPYLKKCKDDERCYWGDHLTLIELIRKLKCQK